MMINAAMSVTIWMKVCRVAEGRMVIVVNRSLAMTHRIRIIPMRMKNVIQTNNSLISMGKIAATNTERKSRKLSIFSRHAFFSESLKTPKTRMLIERTMKQQQARKRLQRITAFNFQRKKKAQKRRADHSVVRGVAMDDDEDEDVGRN